MNESFKNALKNAQTMDDFLKVCGDYYDFKNAKLGVGSKMVLIAHIDKVIALSGAKPKK